jgi:hypothetical protein
MQKGSSPPLALLRGKGDVLQIISFDALETVFGEESYNLKYVPTFLRLRLGTALFTIFSRPFNLPRH